MHDRRVLRPVTGIDQASWWQPLFSFLVGKSFFLVHGLELQKYLAERRCRVPAAKVEQPGKINVPSFWYGYWLVNDEVEIRLVKTLWKESF